MYLSFIFYVIHRSIFGNEQSNRDFEDNFVFKLVSFNKDVSSLIQISLNFDSKCSTAGNLRLVQIMAWPQ